MLDGRQPLRTGGRYAIKHTTRTCAARSIDELEYRVDVNTLEHEPTPSSSSSTRSAACGCARSARSLVDRYRRNRTTGSFILIDEATNDTVAAGMIVGTALAGLAASLRRTHDDGRSPSLRRREIVAPALYLIATGVFVALIGVPYQRGHPGGVDAAGTAVRLAVGSARLRARGRLLEWLPFIAILIAYDSLRGSAAHTFGVHYLPQLRVDEAIFGGTAPTVTLQHWLWHGKVVWYDVLAWGVVPDPLLRHPAGGGGAVEGRSPALPEVRPAGGDAVVRRV